MKYMCYNQTGNISTVDGTSLKLIDKFTYLGSSASSTEKDIEKRLTKAWTAIYRLSNIWKSDLTDKMKRSFFQAGVASILLYRCTTLTLTKRLEKKLDGNYTRILRAILNKSWRQQPTKHQLYGHLPPITKTIQVRRTRHAGHCWRCMEELISDVLQWTPTYDRAKAGRLARTYIQQLCEDTGCSPEDLPEVMNNREKWRERVRYIRACGMIWWWWWFVVYTQLSVFKFQVLILFKLFVFFFCLHTVKYFQVLLFIACTELNCFSNLILIILFNNNHSFTQLNFFKYCLLTLIILSAWIFEMWLDVQYFVRDISDCCSHFYCC